MTRGPLPSAAQGAGAGSGWRAGGGLGRKASWAVCSAGLLRGRPERLRRPAACWAAARAGAGVGLKRVGVRV
jgi:hypothetical protein